MPEPITTDAAGRPIDVGELVGGTTSGRYQDTIIGPIVKIGSGKVKIRVTSSSRGESGLDVFGKAYEKWISTDRVFWVPEIT